MTDSLASFQAYKSQMCQHFQIELTQPQETSSGSQKHKLMLSSEPRRLGLQHSLQVCSYSRLTCCSRVSDSSRHALPGGAETVSGSAV